MKYKSPMEILNLLFKTDTADCSLSVHDRAVLATIITYIHEKTISTEGYKAWPSLDTIISRSGVQLSTLKRCIKVLIKDGWISKESGKGKGNNNTYYVNADKIVQAAALSGAKPSERATGKTVVVDPTESHKRNTTGLLQNKEKATAARNPDGSPMYFPNGKQRKSWDDTMHAKIVEDDDSPF